MIKSSQYIISAVSKDQYPNFNNWPEYVFLGRSNVGKSSIINALTQRKLLAHTSNKPGKTITLNFYLINDDRYFVDVPGYGYALRSQRQRFSFGGYIEEYLKTSKNIKYAFLLVDAKVGPTSDDLLMYDFLDHLQIPIIVVATKLDKIGTTHQFKAKKVILEKLPKAQVVMSSSVTKAGINELLSYLGW